MEDAKSEMAPNSSNIEYEVITDLPPAMLNTVGLEVFRLWTEFALGGTPLNRFRIHHPTGRYASSLSMRSIGPAAVAIMADERIAPEAGILEVGHDEIDLKQFQNLRGQVFPIHRGAAQIAPIAQRPGQKARSVWAQVRSSGFNGFARMPSKITPENADSWVIPEMPAYAPAGVLAALLGHLYGV